MTKELIVSSTPHETKVAILEDDQVVEVYFEREHEYSLAGSIYKGRVTRVLPGMQSAFVNVGLDRDAFLYVSDFFEDVEEYDALVTTAEEKVEKLELERTPLPSRPAPLQIPVEILAGAPSEGPAPEASPAQPGPTPVSSSPSQESRDQGGRRRRRRRRGRGGFPESKYAAAGPGPEPVHTPPPTPAAPPPPAAVEFRTPSRPEPPVHAPVVLPGESLAKYRGRPAEPEAVPEVEPERDEPAPELVAAAPADEPPPQADHLEASSVEESAPAAESVEPPMEPAVEPTIEAAAEPVVEAPTSESLQPAAESLVEALVEAAAQYSAPESAEPAAEPAESAEPAEEGATPAVAEAQVREPARVPRYMSRRMRRKMGKDQPRGGAPLPASRETAPAPGPRPVESARPGRDRDRGMPLISELLREGQEIIVQIAKEPMGKKGARITSHIALPGRYLVYMPTVDHVGVSRRISSDDERQRLKRVLTEFRRSMNMPGGFIVRTAAEGHSDEDLRADVRFLFNLWRECKAQAEKKSAPTLLHRDLNLVERILRDQISMNFSTIWVDSETEYAKIVDFLQISQPALAARVKLYLKDTPIFEEFGVQEQINNSLKSKVWLKSGGYIVINQTEALVAIDINTGKYVGKTQRLEDTIVKTNVDAIKEIVRQIRLRDLGGIIVIDFIDMDERRNRQKVMQALEEALRQDRAPSKALAFNDFGLVAITRKRVKQPLERALGCVCPYCTGSGFVKSAQTVSLEILAESKKVLPQIERGTVTLRVNPEVGKYLKQTNPAILREMEEMGRKSIVVKNDVSLHQENFDFH